MKRLCRLGLAVGLGVGWMAAFEVSAQTAAPTPSTAAAPDGVASAPLALTPVPAKLPELPLSCAEATGRAMSADLKVAQSAQAPLETLIALQEAALTQWRLAVRRCDGKARERAQRLLADNERARERLAEREQAGAQCELSLRDANAMQDLAKAAFGERRWPEAGAYYRKAETLWDLAAEHCTGEQQTLASKRREEAEIDAHNAEACAPDFEKARALTGQLRGLGAGAPPADRERASQRAETAWREAVQHCRGPATDLAKANAEALARDRGTPWVATAAPVAVAATPSRGSGFATVAPSEPMPKPATPTPSATTGLATAVASPVPIAGLLDKAAAAAEPVLKALREAAAPPAAPPAAPLATPLATPLAAQPGPGDAVAVGPVPPTPMGDVDLRAGTARYVGRFSLDSQRRASGEGRVEWDNGDRYEGRLEASARQGQGRFTWANGQQFDGEWRDDQPQGRGTLRYANGDVYEGLVEAGRPHGAGDMRYASGDRFTGLFRAGSPHGRGLYRWANGQSFEGDWNGLTPQGMGVLRFANGNVYEGEVQAGLPEGQGRMRFANGGLYEGQFKAGLNHGQGRYVWPGGDRYEGAWDAGRKHGQGTFFFASGERWVGRFENDERSDEGVFHGKPP